MPSWFIQVRSQELGDLKSIPKKGSILIGVQSPPSGRPVLDEGEFSKVKGITHMIAWKGTTCLKQNKMNKLTDKN